MSEILSIFFAQIAKSVNRNYSQVFHDNNFFSAFSLFPGLISFVLFYIGSMFAHCAIRWAKKFVCGCLCFEGEGDLITSYYPLKCLLFFVHLFLFSAW